MFLNHLRGVDDVDDENLALTEFTDIEGNNGSFGLCPNFYIFLTLFIFTTFFLFGDTGHQESCVQSL